MARIDSFLSVVVEQGASDLHISSAAIPAIRRDGELIPLPFRRLTDRESRRFLFEILSPEEREEFEQNQELDFVYELENIGRFRGNYFEHAHGVGSVFRIVPSSIPDLPSLRLPPRVRDLSQLDNGLVVVCGTTGAGKTTTVSALIDQINQRKVRHVITIEDPIEFVHRSKQSLISQRQVGLHTPSFAAAIRAAISESPDVLFLGELRDETTIRLALSAAGAGILVFGTLHANSAPKAVHRLIDFFPEDERPQAHHTLSQHFRAIMAQMLVPARTGEGRVPIFEMILHTPNSEAMVREGKVHQLESQLAVDSDDGGMIGHDHSLAEAVRAELITLEQALLVSQEPTLLQQWINDRPWSRTGPVT